MKKLFSFALAAFAAMSINAATLQLSLADFGDTGWGGCTYNAATATVTFPVAWDGGIGWWLVADYSQYERIVVEFASPIGMQVALNVEYGTEDASNGYVQEIASAGAKSVEVALDPARKNAVQKIYLQGGAAGSVTLKSAYVTSDQEVDPTQGQTGEDVGEIAPDKSYCYLPLVAIKQYAYFEIKLTNTSNAKEKGWGIGKIVAVSDWNNPAIELLCNNPGLGNVNRYVISQEDMLEYAKKNGVYHSDEYGQQGVHIGAYQGDSEITSVKGFGDGGTTPSSGTKTDIGTPEAGQNYLHIELATLQAYDEFEIVVNITNSEVGVNWGVGKIVPIDYWTGPFFEFKTVKAGAGEQTITIAQADMLEYAKENGVYHTDSYQRQGVTISVYDDKAALVKVVGVKHNGQGVDNVSTAVKAHKVIENGRVIIIRGDQRYDLNGQVIY